MKLEDLKNTWEENKKIETQKIGLTMEELSKILNTRTDSVTLKMKNGIRFSMIMNLVLLIGSAFILVSFGSDTISLIVGLVSFVMLLLFIIYSAGQYRNANTLDESVVSIRESLIRKINFFKVGYRWVVLSLGLTGAFVYLLGSTTYLNIKYGQISLDADDIVVNLVAITLALSIGLLANTREHNHYLRELEVCLADLDNRELSPDFEEDLATRKRKYIWMAVIGLALLILMVLYLIA